MTSPFRTAWGKLQTRYQRTMARSWHRRPLAIHSDVPIVSFTFDDFPRSALHTGGEILRRFGAVGTYYASFGLMDQETPTGRIFGREDLAILLERGHELGSHTFSHCHSWQTAPAEFEKSIVENECALRQMYPGARFGSFSYPISPPRPETKKRTATHFACSRGGGQIANVGVADLNFLRAFFLDKGRDDLAAVEEIIEENRKARGWLIFATHDVCEKPTGFGCKPEFFASVVEFAVRSRARILPIGAAYETLSSAAMSAS